MISIVNLLGADSLFSDLLSILYCIVSTAYVFLNDLEHAIAFNIPNIRQLLDRGLLYYYKGIKSIEI